MLLMQLDLIGLQCGGWRACLASRTRHHCCNCSITAVPDAGTTAAAAAAASMLGTGACCCRAIRASIAATTAAGNRLLRSALKPSPPAAAERWDLCKACASGTLLCNDMQEKLLLQLMLRDQLHLATGVLL
jgi:hypothetical protein